MSAPGEYFKCKCGGVIIFFVKDAPPGYPIPSIGHSKPVEKLGVPNSVRCPVYTRCDSREQLLQEYEKHVKTAERIVQPTEFKPYKGN